MDGRAADEIAGGTDLGALDVTFLMTDVEGSTRLWEAAPQAMEVAMARHDSLVNEVVADHGGTVVKPRGEGDSSFVVFSRTASAVHCAAALQRRFLDERWPPLTPIRVRIAAHRGAAHWRDGDYYGEVVNRCARLRAAAHGSQVVVSQAVRDAGLDALVAPLGAVYLGEHRLRDLVRPERVWQLTHPDLERDFPPLRSASPRRHSLPTELTSFVGRAEEIGQVIDDLRGARLVTLTGPGGVGKTRLAQRVAASLLDELPDGAWFIDLAGVLSDSEVLPAVATGLGVRPEPVQRWEEAVREAVCDRDLLVLLDNCEHLLDAASHAATLLVEAGPNVRVLATSREPLRVTGQRVRPVDPLGTATGDGPVVETRRSDAVTLFCDRMRAHRAFVPKDGAALAAIAEICVRLDGLPLAIEFAAARTRAMSVVDLLRLLDRQVSVLGGGHHWQGSDRQRTLEATLDWSYRLLDTTEQAVLARLGVFQGGFTLSAASAVCSDVVDDMQCLDVVSSLVDKSLVVAQERGVSMRYRLLESTGEFAESRLNESGDAEVARLRHAEHFTRVYTEIAGAMGTEDEASAWPRVMAESRNLLAALTWCLVGTGPRERGASLAAALGLAWNSIATPAEAIRWLELALAASLSDDLLEERAAILEALSTAAWLSSDGRGMMWNEGALGLARTIGDRDAVSRLSYRFGLWRHFRGDREGALETLRDVVTTAEADGDDGAVARALFGIGRISFIAGNLVEAETSLHRAWVGFDQLGDRRHQANVGLWLSEVRAVLGDASAATILEHAGRLLAELGDRTLVSDTLVTRAVVAALLNRDTEAQQTLSEAITTWYREGRGDAFGPLEIGVILAARSRAWWACARLSGALAARDERTRCEIQPDIAARSAEAIELARAALTDTIFDAEMRRGRGMLPREVAELIAAGFHARP